MIYLYEYEKNIIKSRIGCRTQIFCCYKKNIEILAYIVKTITEKTKNDAIIMMIAGYNNQKSIHEKLKSHGCDKNTYWIDTVYRIAKQILESYGHAIGLSYDINIIENDINIKTIFIDYLRIYKKDIYDFLYIKCRLENKKIENILNDYLIEISYVKKNLMTEDEIIKRFDKKDVYFLEIYKSYNQALALCNSIDCDDVLLHAKKILLEQPWCADIYRSKYKHVCVDEDQYLSFIEREFIKSFCDDKIKSIFIIGCSDNHECLSINSSEESLRINFQKYFSAQSYEFI